MLVTIKTTHGTYQLDGIKEIKQYPVYVYFNGPGYVKPVDWKKNGLRRDEILAILCRVG